MQAYKLGGCIGDGRGLRDPQKPYRPQCLPTQGITNHTHATDNPVHLTLPDLPLTARYCPIRQAAIVPALRPCLQHQLLPQTPPPAPQQVGLVKVHLPCPCARGTTAAGIRDERKTGKHDHPPTCLPDFLPACLLAAPIPTNLPTLPSTHSPLPNYVPLNLPAHLPTCMRMGGGRAVFAQSSRSSSDRHTGQQEAGKAEDTADSAAARRALIGCSEDGAACKITNQEQRLLMRTRADATPHQYSLREGRKLAQTRLGGQWTIMPRTSSVLRKISVEDG